VFAFNFLTPSRNPKPGTGITMMLDKGMGPVMVEDLMQMAGEHVNLAKLGWGTSLIHERDLIKEKNEIYQAYGVTPYPGGTLLEIAVLKNKLEEFLEEAEALGFGAIEISDGTIDIAEKERSDIINKVKEHGFIAITEVGKKDPEKDIAMDLTRKVEIVKQDIDDGADWVLLESREGGKGIGIYDEKGNVKEDQVHTFMEMTQPEKIIWEAPQKNQQIYLILNLGPNVNLGNIAPDDITSLETMRRGLRGDTLGKVNL
jgi:phosphosulfolactate synthase